MYARRRFEGIYTNFERKVQHSNGHPLGIRHTVDCPRNYQAMWRDKRWFPQPCRPSSDCIANNVPQNLCNEYFVILYLSLVSATRIWCKSLTINTTLQMLHGGQDSSNFILIASSQGYLQTFLISTSTGGTQYAQYCGFSQVAHPACTLDA